MAFNTEFFYKASAGYGRDHVPQTYVYKSANETLAEVMASAYFKDVEGKLKLDDLIYISASDDRKIVYVSGVDPITTSVLQFQ